MAGRPVVVVAGFVVLLLFAFARPFIQSLATMAHEGGHIVVGILTGRYKSTVESGGFHIAEGGKGDGGATDVHPGWGAGIILSALAGYLTPPLAGLGGTALVLQGRAWSLLLALVILLLGALFQAKDWFTRVVVVMFGVMAGWTLAAGPQALQEGVAVGVVWTMLLGGITGLFGQRFGADGSDAAVLARYTLVPRILWVALFWFVAVVCFWLGARRLLAL